MATRIERTAAAATRLYAALEALHTTERKRSKILDMKRVRVGDKLEKLNAQIKAQRKEMRTAREALSKLMDE